MVNEFASDSLSNTGHFAFNIFVYMVEIKTIYKHYTLYFKLILKQGLH